MPKISLPTDITNTEAKLETLINEIEYLLEGKLDNDNLFSSGFTTIPIPPKKIIDLADDTRPVEGNKFFGSTPDSNYKFRDDIFDPLITLMNTNKTFIPIEARESFLINSNPEIPEKKEINAWDKIKSFAPYAVAGLWGAQAYGAKKAYDVVSDWAGGFWGSKPKKKKTEAQKRREALTEKLSEETNIYNREVIIKKPPFLKLVSRDSMRQFFPDNEDNYGDVWRPAMFTTCIDVRSNLTEEDSSKVTVELGADSYDETVFNVNLTTSPLESTDYINVDVTILALYEVLP